MTRPHFRTQHAADHGPRAEERAIEIRAQHGVPFLAVHHHQVPVARDPGVVHEDVDRPERGRGVGHQALDLRLVGDVAWAGPGARPRRRQHPTRSRAASSRSRYEKATAAPRRASSSTMARPMPRDPPVTSATRPDRASDSYGTQVPCGARAAPPKAQSIPRESGHRAPGTGHRVPGDRVPGTGHRVPGTGTGDRGPADRGFGIGNRGSGPLSQRAGPITAVPATGLEGSAQRVGVRCGVRRATLTVDLTCPP